MLYVITYSQLGVFIVKWSIRKLEGGKIMEYVKPVVINADVVNFAKCGDGPCGRPCSVNRS